MSDINRASDMTIHPEPPHLSDELLASWAADELAGDERETARHHLASCGECQRALEEATHIHVLAWAAGAAASPGSVTSVAERVLAALPDRPRAHSSAEETAPVERGGAAPVATTRSQRDQRRDLWRRMAALVAVVALIASSALLFARLSSQSGSSYQPGPPGLANIPGNWRDALPAGSMISDVAVVSPTDIWVVGVVDTGAGFQALLMHFDGRYWQRSSDQFPYVDLNSISMISADEGWAIGGQANFSSVLLHYSGGHWRDATASLDTRSLRTNKVTLSSLHMASATSGWMLGTEAIEPLGAQPAQIFQYQKAGNSYQWEPVAEFQNTILYGLSVVSDHEVWAAGVSGQSNWKTTIIRLTINNGDGPANSTSIRLDSQTWDVGPGTLYSISMRSSTDGWVAGAGEGGGGDENGVGILYHWDGHEWRQKPFVPDGQEAGAIAGVAMTAANTGWVYGANQNYLYSTANNQWFGYPLAEDDRVIAGAPATPGEFFAIVITAKLGAPTAAADLKYTPVVYQMGQSRPLPTPTPLSP